MTRSDNLRHIDLVNVLIICTLFFSLLLRIIWLENIPGINADEAWYGIIALNIISGDYSQLVTPSGNLLNPFYILPVIILHFLFAPSFLLLRVTSLLSGILLIIFTYFAIKDLQNKKMALVVAIFIATLPLNIAYSRFGWDTSQTVLISCVVIYALLKSNWILLVFSTLAAVMIHPTNIGLFIFSLLFIFISKLSEAQYSKEKKVLSILFSSIVLLIFTAIIYISPLSNWLPSITAVISRMVNIQEMGNFLLNFSRLITGGVVYEYITGVKSSLYTSAIDTMFTIGLVFMMAFLIFKSYKVNNVKIFSFSCSFVLMLGIWYVSFSSFPLQPGSERYSLFLLYPFVLCVGYFLQMVSEYIHYRKLIIGSLIIGNLIMMGFVKNYFIQIYDTGGESQLTFRTNYIEPKKMVFNKVNEEKSKDKVSVIASQWWNAQPLMYLGYNDKQFNVIESYKMQELILSEDEDIFVSTFVGDELDENMKNKYAYNIENAWVFNTFANEPHMMLYKLKPMTIKLIAN